MVQTGMGGRFIQYFAFNKVYINLSKGKHHELHIMQR